jgi:hypothetical protein
LSVDANSLTLTDYALMSNSPLIQKISFSLLTMGMVLQDVPMRQYKSMLSNGARYDGTSMPTINWRRLNDGYTVTKAVPTPFQEQAYIASNAIDIDVKILDDVNRIQDPFSLQLMVYLKGLAYDFNDKFVNNNHVTGDSDAPVGLRYRLDNYADYGIPSEMKLSAAATDISAGSNVPKLLYYFDNMFIRMGVPEGDGVVIYINEQLSTLLNFGLKLAGTTGGFGFVKDPFERSTQTYKNAKIRVIGRKSDQSTQIITATEDTAGLDAASTYSSAYFVKYGMEDAFHAWEFDSLENSVIGPFKKVDEPQERLAFDWAVGFWQESTRCIGRVYNIKVA